MHILDLNQELNIFPIFNTSNMVNLNLKCHMIQKLKNFIFQ